jgi:hypothetical protein
MTKRRIGFYVERAARKYLGCLSLSLGHSAPRGCAPLGRVEGEAGRRPGQS